MATKADKMSADTVLDLIQNRRSYYALTKELPIPPARVEEIAEAMLTWVPSSYNSQTNRVLALFGANHDKLWGEIVYPALKAIVPAEKWEATSARLAGFKAAGATVGGQCLALSLWIFVPSSSLSSLYEKIPSADPAFLFSQILFFTDKKATRALQDQFAGSGYEDRFPPWALQSSAMVQFATWVAIEAEGLGANLQHYNPLIDEKVRAEWGLPADWELIAQLVVGGRAGEPREKTFKPIQDMYKSFGV